MQQLTITGGTSAAGGSTTTAATLKITLAGYGSFIPELVNGEILSETSFSVPVVDGLFSFPVWGNDLISPAGTWYCIQLFDSKKNCVAANNYQLVGSGTLQLSAVLPYDPTRSQGILYVATLNNQGPPGPPGGLAGALNPGQTPVGVIDGINRTFLIAGNPAVPMLFKNGSLMDSTGGDYTFAYTSPTQTTITYTVASTPRPAQADGTGADNHFFIGYSSANLETDITNLVNPIVGAAVTSAIASEVATLVATQVAAALSAQVPKAVATALIALGIIPSTAAIAFTADDGLVYLVRSLFNQIDISLAPAGTTGAPTSYPIQDAAGTTVYLLTMGAQGQFNDPAPVLGVANAPTGYDLPDPNQNTNVLQVIGTQIQLTLQQS